MRLCSIIDRFAKLVIVERCLGSPERWKFAQLLLVCSSWSTRFYKDFFSRTRSCTCSRESLPVKSSRMARRSLRSSFSFCS